MQTRKLGINVNIFIVNEQVKKEKSKLKDFVKYLTYIARSEDYTPGYMYTVHDDVIKWKHFSRYWAFVQGIHRSPVNSPHKGQWRGALMFSLICAWINSWVNNCEAGDLRRYRAHYDVTVTLKSEYVNKTKQNAIKWYTGSTINASLVWK